MRAILACCVLTAALGFNGLSAGPQAEVGPAWMYAAALALAGIQAVGAITIAMGQRRLGAMVVLMGTVPLVPLGLIGAWGARGVMDDATVAAFQRQRRSRV